MPNILTNIKKQIIQVFQKRLQFFLDNYGQKFRKQAPDAIDKFIQANMIRKV